jgi:formylglycine-generating enzyme required for sulfatase activity
MPNYPGYSADFFDGRHYVLLGASWATDERLVRKGFRNWFQPHYPHTFSKFRCLYDL